MTTVIDYLPGKTIDLKVPIGAPLDQFAGTVTYKCLQTGVPLREERDATQFGVPYISTAVPIMDGEEMVGVIAAVASNVQGEALRVGASQLSAVLADVSSTTEQLTGSSNDVASRLSKLSEESQGLNVELQKINTVLEFVEDVASRSKMLGFNASIEAARAGDHGRGFSVVAAEIQNMAEQSRSAATEITSLLENIKQSVARVDDTLQQIAGFTEEQAAGMEEMSATFQQIGATAESLLQAAVGNKEEIG
ncbi:methyl-accepting chemotaxis protein [Alicyclobacillus dauci]|uniref:Methyl-accepting chemotaxis protein n=1 Tax=Alicyclobacillus dauci TaxID=1475485 RepID=A0ABY6Z505_9BACL|nr:methyl-accepting chemotaxis protein [Alicyclobacillus dauci]WAH37100.1 methyl-accepting chemotaxis protein [Alicyclobacillus dauci]